MKQGFPFVRQWQIAHADHDAIGVGKHLLLGVAERVGDAPQHIASRNTRAQARPRPQNAIDRRARPARSIGYLRRGGRVPSPIGGQHAQQTHDPLHTPHARRDGPLVETQRFARLVGQHRHVARLRVFPKTPFAQFGIEDHRHTECFRHGLRLGPVTQLRPHLGKVGTMNRPGMQIDDMRRQIDDLLAKQRRDTRPERPDLAARKATIQVTSIG